MSFPKGLSPIPGTGITSGSKSLRPDVAVSPFLDLSTALEEVALEVRNATSNWPPMNSMHEAYGVLLEEVDELWEHVKTKQRNRNLHAARKEAMQVAAMAIRFMLDVCNEERGRK
jgi:hypothetical protein